MAKKTKPKKPRRGGEGKVNDPQAETLQVTHDPNQTSGDQLSRIGTKLSAHR